MSQDKPFSKFIGQPKPEDKPLENDQRAFNQFYPEIDNPIGPSYIGQVEGSYDEPPPENWEPPDEEDEED